MEKNLDNQYILTYCNTETSLPIINMSSTYNTRNTTANGLEVIV